MAIELLLSEQIRDLEAQLRVKLFDRSSRKVQLNPAGTPEKPRVADHALSRSEKSAGEVAEPAAPLPSPSRLTRFLRQSQHRSRLSGVAMVRLSSPASLTTRSTGWALLTIFSPRR
jgi:hypothetical protein